MNMVQLLRKLFIKNYDQLADEKVRVAHGKMASLFGIISNLVLFAGKMLAGFFSASISIIADSINNLADMGSSVITLIGFKLAAAPADKEHPYGHQRIEYITGLVVAVIIMIVGGSLLVTSIEKIIGYEIVEIDKKMIIISCIILAVSILVKFWQSLFNKKVGKIINSVALMATSKDSLNDCFSTLAILIGNIVIFFVPNLPFSLDGVLGILVSLFIVVSGIKLIKDTVNPLIGVSIDSDFVKKIIRTIKEEPMVLGYHDLVCHMYGPTKCFMTIHVEVDANQKLLEIHDVIDNLERRIREDFDVELTIHMDPIQIDNPEINELRKKLKDVIKEIDSGLSMHDFRVVAGPTHTNLIFDVVRPFKFKLSDGEILKLIQNQMNDKKYYFIVHFDDEIVENNINEEYEDENNI